MSILKWKKNGLGEGWTANGDHGSYFAERQPNGKFQAILDGCDEYGPPELLRTLKDRCQALEDNRSERAMKAGSDLPAPVQPTLARFAVDDANASYDSDETLTPVRNDVVTDKDLSAVELDLIAEGRMTDPRTDITIEDVPATDHDLDLHNATKPIPAPSAESRTMPKINAKIAAAKTTQAGLPPHLVIEALAGTGKTTTLIEGLKVLRGIGSKLTPSPQQKAVWDALEESRDAKTVCFVAFNKSIAKELADRVPAGCEAKTMHGLGFGAVRKAFGNVDVNEYKVQDLLLEMTGVGSRPVKPSDRDYDNSVAYADATDAYKAAMDAWTARRAEKAVVLHGAGKLADLARLNLTDVSDRSEIADLAAYYDVDLTADEDDGGLDYSDEIYALVPRVLEACKDVRATNSIDFTDMVWLPVALDLPVFKYDLLLWDEVQDGGRCTQALALRAGKRLVLVGDKNQAIYGFAGADCESIDRMIGYLRETSRGVKVLPLTVTRRCGKAIVREAQELVPAFEAHENNPAGEVRTIAGSFEENPGANDYRPMVKDGDMVLCRCNAPLVAEAFGFIKAGRKANIQGRDIGQGLISLVRKMNAAEVPDLIARLEAWRDRETAKELARKNPNETKITTVRDKAECIVCLAEGAFTADEVVRKIESVFTDDKTKPGIKLSSVHKAKGQEARRVFLLQPKGAEVVPEWLKLAWEIKQSHHLLYVARTRAIESLYYIS